MDSVSNFISLKTLVYLREKIKIKQISEKLKDLVLDKQHSFFNVWTEMLNDDI